MPIDRHQERRKKRRESIYALILAVSFLLLLWLEFRVFTFGKQLPLNQSIFFFGLVNFNLILLLSLSFFILRNLFKAFVTQRRGIIGNSLKSRLIATFLGFSVVPTALMFVIAFFYINASFDRWFNDKMQGVLKSALEVKTEFYASEKKKNFNAAFQLAESVSADEKPVSLKLRLEQFRKTQSLDVVEIYWSLDAERVVSLIPDETVPVIPTVSVNTLRRVISNSIDVAEIQQMNQGHLVRVLVPLKHAQGAVAISSFIPISMVSKMDEVALAYEDMREINYPLKSIYLVILILMTGMILVCSVWFGLYIAKHLSSALEKLGDATQKVGEGDYEPVVIDVAESEVQTLADNFNGMVAALTKARKETTAANQSLTYTMKELDERRRYTQVVLANVSTGVVSFDKDDRITMINDRAAELLGMEKFSMIHKHAKDVLGEKYYRLFNQMVLRMKAHRLPSIKKELVFDMNETSVPTMLTLSPLTGEDREVLGTVVVLDDLSDVIQAQRAAAWKEVARRIAHEVKNPLTPIKLSAQRLQKKFPQQMQDADFKACTDMIIEQTDSLKFLINEFSQFARLPENRPRLSDINEVVEKAFLVYRQSHNKIQFVFDKDTQIEPFFFDPEQMKRAIYNLVLNSVDALAGISDASVVLKTTLDKGASIVVLSVIDNGKAVTDADMKRMFEPYYTKSEEGSGLGLTIVKKIVEDHNGFIRLEKNEPRGMTARIELPYIKV